MTKANGNGNGKAKVGRPRAFSDAQLSQFLARDAAGWTIGEIAKFYSINKHTLRKAFARLDQGLSDAAPSP